MLYNIILIDSRGLGETPPIIKTVDLTDEEYVEMKMKVEDFEDTRMPYIYPQMYIYKIENIEIGESIDFIDEMKDEVVQWQEEHEERKKILREWRKEQEEAKKLLESIENSKNHNDD